MNKHRGIGPQNMIVLPVNTSLIQSMGDFQNINCIDWKENLTKPWMLFGNIFSYVENK